MGDTQLLRKEELLAQEFMAYMLSPDSEPEELLRRAERLPVTSMTTVAAVAPCTTDCELFACPKLRIACIYNEHHGYSMKTH